MTRTMLMHAELRCPKDIMSTGLWTMAMDYDICIYNRIPDMQSGLSAIEIWLSSRFYPVSETLGNSHVLGFPTYVLEPKFHKPGVNINKWDTRSQRGVNMGLAMVWI